MTDNQTYYRRRAEQERARAAAAEQPECRRIHAELATRYEERARMPARPRLKVVL